MGQDSLVFLIKELLHMDVLLCQIYLQLLVVALVKGAIRMVKSVGNGVWIVQAQQILVI